MNWNKTLQPGSTLNVEMIFPRSNFRSWVQLQVRYDEPMTMGDLLKEILNARMIINQTNGRQEYDGTLMDLALTRLDQSKPTGTDFSEIAKVFSEMVSKVMNPVYIHERPSNYPEPDTPPVKRSFLPPGVLHAYVKLENSVSKLCSHCGELPEHEGHKKDGTEN